MDEAEGKYILHGEVTNLKQFPLQLDFWTMMNSKQRKVLQDRLDEEGDKMDLSLNC